MHWVSAFALGFEGFVSICQRFSHIIWKLDKQKLTQRNNNTISQCIYIRNRATTSKCLGKIFESAPDYCYKLVTEFMHTQRKLICWNYLIYLYANLRSIVLVQVVFLGAMTQPICSYVKRYNKNATHLLLSLSLLRKFPPFSTRPIKTISPYNVEWCSWSIKWLRILNLTESINGEHPLKKLS